MGNICQKSPPNTEEGKKYCAISNLYLESALSKRSRVGNNPTCIFCAANNSSSIWAN